MDASEIINPKKTINRRMEEAEGHTPPIGGAAHKKEEVAEGHKGVPFGKKWSAEERAEHQRQLAKKLRNR